MLERNRITTFCSTVQNLFSLSQWFMMRFSASSRLRAQECFSITITSELINERVSNVCVNRNRCSIRPKHWCNMGPRQPTMKTHAGSKERSWGALLDEIDDTATKNFDRTYEKLLTRFHWKKLSMELYHFINIEKLLQSIKLKNLSLLQQLQLHEPFVGWAQSRSGTTRLAETQVRISLNLWMRKRKQEIIKSIFSWWSVFCWLWQKIFFAVVVRK